MKTIKVSFLLLSMIFLGSSLFAQNRGEEDRADRSQVQTQTMKTVIEDGRLKKWVNGELVEDRELLPGDMDGGVFSFDFAERHSIKIP